MTALRVFEKNLTSKTISVECSLGWNLKQIHWITNQFKFGKIMSDCRLFLSNYLNFVRRQSNFVAHSLAMRSKLYVSSYEFDYILSFYFSYLDEWNNMNLLMYKKKILTYS